MPGIPWRQIVEHQGTPTAAAAVEFLCLHIAPRVTLEFYIATLQGGADLEVRKSQYIGGGQDLMCLVRASRTCASRTAGLGCCAEDLLVAADQLIVEGRDDSF